MTVGHTHTIYIASGGISHFDAVCHSGGLGFEARRLDKRRLHFGSEDTNSRSNLIDYPVPRRLDNLTTRLEDTDDRISDSLDK